MFGYLTKRLLLLIPTLFGISLIVFFIMHAMPADVVSSMMAESGSGLSSKEADAKALRAKFGLDKPLYQQYATWVGQAIRFDFGKSWITGEPVSKSLRSKFFVTFSLTVWALAIAFILAVPAGILSATHQDTWIDYLVRSLAVGGLSIPTFWMGILLILFFLKVFHWGVPLGFANPWENPVVHFQQMILPALVLGFHHVAVISRVLRSSLLDTLREDYVRLARAKGLQEQAVLLRHALRNALLPVVTLAGVQFAVMLSGIVVIETVFNLPGLGRLLVDSVARRDNPVVEGAILMAAVSVTLTNLLVDVAYGGIDPRVRVH